MVSLPEALKSYQDQAEAALKQGAVKDIEFSGPTYQVLVEDPISQSQLWVFLQLDGNGAIQDAFCSDDHHQDTPNCLHVAIAYLSLYKSYSQPLHQRFNHSLWNALCQLFEERLGSHSEIFHEESPGHYFCRSPTGKRIFSLAVQDPNDAQLIEQVIHRTSQETEETSLKFSNLSAEEIALWREGRPLPQLRYDLSPWSDLAKWLMKMQEEGRPYEISFQYSKRELPNWFQIDFKDVSAGFYVSEANLPLVVDSLTTVETPLRVFYDRRTIERITYDKKEQALKIEETKKVPRTLLSAKKETRQKEVVQIQGWSFIPGKGFYADEPHELLRRPVLHGVEIPDVLTDHARLIASLIVDCHVHRETITLSYQLHFDAEWNLHILAYLFEPGDLFEGDSWLMDNWAYLNDDGFYPIEGNRFDSSETVVRMTSVSEFVTQNRAWLDMQEGFHTHVRSIEYQLNYHIEANRRLTFSRSLAKAKEGVTLQDFGVWVYLEGYGFYSKTAVSFHYLLKPGISLSPEQIPLFIRMNRDELQLIPHFFADMCPVVKAGLKIELTDKRKVKITPEYELLPEHREKKIILYDDYVYLDGDGFFELPFDLRLPDKFRNPMELEGDELLFFLTDELDSIVQYASEIDPRLQKLTEYSLITDSIEAVPEKGRGWYRLSLHYVSGKAFIPVSTLRQAMGKKFPFAFLEAGLVDLRAERLMWLRKLDKGRFEKKSNSLLLTALEFMRLNAFDPIDFFDSGAQNRESGEAILEKLTHMVASEQPDLGGMFGHLRPYQMIGVKWLWFLYKEQLSGLLCDDMGLGKTHQAMALMAGLVNLFRTLAEGTKLHCLIVCPTSVIYHWQEKLHQFLPNLKVSTFYGSKRTLEDFHQQYDILLTSYGTLRNEREAISKLFFELAIFDEIQIAKNQFSRIYAALMQVKATMKIGLTGTPIENYLRELKSLFDLTLPSYLPSEHHFRDFFIRPIEKEHNQERKKLLSRLIHPFILRRKKEDVLPDLPEKTEEIAYCDLSLAQYQLYTEVLQRRRHHLLEELQNNQHVIPYMHIFALLSSLKQICDHPAVYLKAPADYQNYSSGKWELFVELLSEARASRQKVVVYSQYLGMLDIIEAFLKEERIGFAALRGATINRKEQLMRFNRDPECEVFVGSLQAAGLGIDLTAGSVVIHYDRWWNAARENQATDRVHRIGQTRGVQVFKLVTKGTFEEKIDAMILRKGKLMEEVVGVDDQHLLKTFSRNELVELLELAAPPHP